MGAERLAVLPVLRVDAMGDDGVVRRLVDFKTAILIGMALRERDEAKRVLRWPARGATSHRPMRSSG